MVFTGQHPKLNLREFGLEAFQALHLGCPGEEDPDAHVRQVTAALLPLLRQPPALLIVQGDTSSALGAALAGFVAGVPVAHVEAGLRTHDPALPWPEEGYRTAIDARADLLFAPTEQSAQNLADERVAGTVHVTGNTGVDALLSMLPQIPQPVRHRRDIPGVLVTCHRRESWAEGLGEIAAALTDLAGDGIAHIQFVLHPNAHVAGRMKALLRGQAAIELLPPCSHAELIQRMRVADLVLSDSGGIQEEAPALGVPLLVLREKTERPEGIATGNMRLVGTTRERIVAQASSLLCDPSARAAMSKRAFPYGDGQAAPRIAAIIEEWLEAGRKTPMALNW